MKIAINEPIHIQTKDGTVYGFYLEDGTVKIIAGSQFNMHEANSLYSFSREKRAYLLNNGYVSNGVLIKDYIFDSPSSAICALKGNMMSGNSCFFTTDNVELGIYLDSLKDTDSVSFDEPRHFLAAERKLVSSNSFPRNQSVAKNVIIHSNYKCNIDPNHSTFITKNNKPYMEAHHLIPLSAQDSFKDAGLDTEANIVCLCPTCHRFLHYGLNIEEYLKKLFELRKVALSKTGINISFEDLKKFYE